MDHATITLIYWLQTLNNKGLLTNDTPIWRVTNIILVAILFQLTPCTLCVNTQMSKAVIAKALEPVQLIATTILPATRIKNEAFLDFIDTVGMHSKLVKGSLPSKPLLLP